MKPITQFQSETGRIFKDEESALKHDALFKAQNEVSKLLPQAVDDSCEFSNGGGFIQHTPNDIEAFSLGLRRLLAMEFGDDSAIVKHWDAGNSGYIGRYLDNSGSNTYRLLDRFLAIDKLGREWGQPFYAAYPEDGRQKLWPNVSRLGIKHFD